MLRFALILMATATPLAAEPCPPVPDRTAELAVLFNAAQQATDDRMGRVLSNRMWEIWAEAPDAHAQDLLDEGMERRGAFDLDGAKAAFDELVAYCPDYAEGYNQRAFVAFLREDYEAALVDLDRALDRLPLHVAAQAGKALTLMGLGQNDAAQDVLRAALKLNPWLPERGLLRGPRDGTL